MKPVILVSLDWRRPQDGRTGLGIASIAAALQVAGVSLNIENAQVNGSSFSFEQIQRQLEQPGARGLGFSRPLRRYGGR